MNKVEFLKELSIAHDRALIATDTIQGTKNVDRAYRHAIDTADVLVSYSEALEIFKAKF